MGQEKGLTKDCIFTALLMLMEQKDYKYITITDIAHKAGVSRMTYYRLYNSKEDILAQKFREIACSITEKSQTYSDGKSRARAALCAYFSFFRENSRLLSLLDEAELMKLLIDSFASFTDFLCAQLHSLRESRQDAYTACFQSGGLFAVLKCWLDSGAREEPDQMAVTMLQIMC